MLMVQSKTDGHRDAGTRTLFRHMGFMLLDVVCMAVLLGFCILATFVAGL